VIDSHYMNSIALWITGLPGSGKSTIADEVRKLHPDFIMLRMDALRKIVTLSRPILILKEILSTVALCTPHQSLQNMAIP